MDPCVQILRKIRDMKAQLERREAQLAKDRYGLFKHAYSRNPGGLLRKKGTYVGHLKIIEGYKVGLKKEIAKAKKMGCL
jgi:hypothetical protein